MIRRNLVLAFSTATLVAGAYIVWQAAVPPTPAAAVEPLPSLDLARLLAARVTVDPERGEITIELPAVDLPAGAHAHASHHAVAVPAAVAELPVGGAVTGFRTELLDAAGRPLPADLVHHFNVLDPRRRELFLPIAQRVAASGKETGAVRFPWLLVGKPFQAGDRVVASAMLHSPTSSSYRGVRARMVWQYVPARRPWPLFTVAPWQLDVAFPVGDKSFDLPPGRSERSYEGSPAVPGHILAIGGHLHDYGERLELWDVTTNELIWRGAPARDSSGRVGAVPIRRLYGFTRLGVHITPRHRYRVRVVYDNPTGHVVPAGGMGVVAGLFLPDRGVAWPAADPRDSLYQADLRHFTRLGPAPGRSSDQGRAGVGEVEGEGARSRGHADH